MAESEPVLTVAICTRNRHESLLRALGSLAGQRGESTWEVLVVDNASQDGSGEAARSLRDDFPVPLAIAIEPEPGLSHARNRALRSARGRALVFADDDVTFREGWLAAHLQAFADPDVIATGGPIRPVLPEDLDADWRQFLESELGGPTSRYDFGQELQEIPGSRGLLLPFGANFGVERAAALSVGGFRADLGWGRRRIPGEETDLLQRLVARPGRMLYLPDAAVDHHIEAARATREHYLRWCRGYGRSLARLDPPRGARERIGRALHQFARALRWSMGGGDIRARRERESALGHALELLAR